MAKKVVATLKTGTGKEYTKVIRMIKSPEGQYSFQEEMVLKEFVKDYLASK